MCANNNAVQKITLKITPVQEFDEFRGLTHSSLCFSRMLFRSVLQRGEAETVALLAPATTMNKDGAFLKNCNISRITKQCNMALLSSEYIWMMDVNLKGLVKAHAFF